MVDTVRAAGGVGLAANQVGDLRRVIVIQLPDEEEARIYINPEISRRKGERTVSEGCLSHPGYRALVNRSLTVRFGALDHSEKAVKIDAEGLLAQAMEHETDHLNGILYLDHLAEHAKPYRVDAEGRRLDADGNPMEDEPEGEGEYESETPSADAPQADAAADRDAPVSMAVR